MLTIFLSLVRDQTNDRIFHLPWQRPSKTSLPQNTLVQNLAKQNNFVHIICVHREMSLKLSVKIRRIEKKEIVLLIDSGSSKLEPLSVTEIFGPF